MHSSDLTSILAQLTFCFCLLLSHVCSVLVNIDRYKGEIQETHNLLRSRQNAADMKYMVSKERLLLFDTLLAKRASF